MEASRNGTGQFCFGDNFQSEADAVLFRIQKFRKARILLQEREVFIIAGVITIGSAKIDRDFQICERRIGFAREAIERGDGVHNVIGFWREFARFIEAFSSFIPASEIHHCHAALIVLFRSARILFRLRLHALLGNFDVHARAIRKLFAGTFHNFFQLLFRFGVFLLVKQGQRFVVGLHLRLDERIDKFDPSALNGGWRG